MMSDTVDGSRRDDSVVASTKRRSLRSFDTPPERHRLKVYCTTTSVRLHIQITVHLIIAPAERYVLS